MPKKTTTKKKPDGGLGPLKADITVTEKLPVWEKELKDLIDSHNRLVAMLQSATAPVKVTTMSDVSVSWKAEEKNG